MSDDIVRINCCKDGCGTFPMDRALFNRYKRTGETWACPAGHEQHFTESKEQQLREEISELKNKLDSYKERLDSRSDTLNKLWKERQEEKDRRKFAESRLLDYAKGIVEVAPEQFRWSCECESRGQKAFDSVDEARKALKKHRRRYCPIDSDEEVTIHAEQ